MVTLGKLDHGLRAFASIDILMEGEHEIRQAILPHPFISDRPSFVTEANPVGIERHDRQLEAPRLYTTHRVCTCGASFDDQLDLVLQC